MIPRARTSKGPILKLDGAIGICSDLITVKTGKIKRNATIQKIKINFENWVKNKNFDGFRKELLDLAIVAKVNKQRMNKQDLDNLAKVVLDALKKDPKSDFKPEAFLFFDDAQIVRLLVYKIPREEDDRYDTDGLIISFRKHAPEREMELEKED